MRQVFGVSVVFAMVLAWCATGVAQASKVDVTGDWVLTVQTDAGQGGEPKLTLKQDGEKLTGHYSSETLGEADLTGSVKGTAIEWSFEAQLQGAAVPVTYSGTVTATTMEGKMAIAGGALNGTFTGKKQ